MTGLLLGNGEKILVTGAAGFVGRHLCNHLLGNGFLVRALVRESRSMDTISDRNFEQCFGDLLNLEFLTKACDGIDTIVHLGGLAHITNSTSEQIDRINVRGTELLLAAADKQRVRRFVFMSSSLAATTDSQGIATTAYGRAKVAAEKLVMAQHKLGNMVCVILRPVNIYGPGMRGNIALLISLVLSRLALPLPRLQTSLSLIGVEDVCDAVGLVIMSENSCGKTYTLTDGVCYIISDIEDAIYRQTGRNLPTWRTPRLLLYIACVGVESLRKLLSIFGFQIGLLDSIGMKAYNNLTVDNLFGNEDIREDLGFKPKTTFYQSLSRIVEGLDG